jgi:hypothetical protein
MSISYSNFHLDKPQILVRAVREPLLALWLTHLKMAINQSRKLSYNLPFNRNNNASSSDI